MAPIVPREVNETWPQQVNRYWNRVGLQIELSNESEHGSNKRDTY